MKYDYTGDRRDEQDENCRGDGLAIGDSFGAALGEAFGGDSSDGDDSAGTERDAEMERDTKLADSLGSGFGGGAPRSSRIWHSKIAVTTSGCR